MNAKEKFILALLVGLAAMVVTLFLLSIPSTQAAMLMVNRAADSGCGILGAHESITAAISLTGAQSSVTWDNQAAENEAEACTIGIATGESTMTSTIDGRPVLWKNRDYFGRSDTWQASLFRHKPTSGYFSDNHEDDDRYGDSFAYVALSDRGDESQGGIAEETDFYPRAGVNEEGLGLVQAQAHTLENGSQASEGVNNGGLNHWILSRCKTIAEVEQLLADTNDGGGYNGSKARNTASLIAVIDRSGEAVIFEVDGNSFARQNITKEFTRLDERPHSIGPPAGGYNGFDYRSNFSRISFTNPISGFLYFTDVCTETITGGIVVHDCQGFPDGINDLEDSSSSVKRWSRVAFRMDDATKDHQYFIQKWLWKGGHPREFYLETVARSVGYAPYLTSRVNSVFTPTHNWKQEKPTGWHLNRFVTVSSVVIVGSKADDQDEGKLTTMWVALGEPSVAIFVPVFPYAGQPPAVLDNFFLSVNAKRRLVYDYETDADGYPVDNIDDTSPYTRVRNYDHSIDLSALFGGNYYGEGGLQAYNFAIEEELYKAYQSQMNAWRTLPADQITPAMLANWQAEKAAWAMEEYVKSDPTVVTYEAELAEDGVVCSATTGEKVRLDEYDDGEQVDEWAWQLSESRGYLSCTHQFTGRTIVEVIAKGTPDNGQWPKMKVYVDGECLTEVGGETESDCSIIVSPTNATNKAKDVGEDIIDPNAPRFALYRYRTTLTGTATLTVEAVDATPTKALSIDKIIIRTEPRSVEMYEVEKDWDAKSASGVITGTYRITLTDETGYFDVYHYLWNVPLTIEVVARDAEIDGQWSRLGLYYREAGASDWRQVETTVTLTSGYSLVYTFSLTTPDFKGLAEFRIRSGNSSDIEVDKLLVKESLAVNSNNAPIGCFAVDSTIDGPTMTIIATAVVTDPDGDAIASYFWDFGDGESYCSGNPVVTHTYDVTANLCLLTLYVTDHRGKTAIIRRCVYLPIIMKNHS